MGASIRTQRTEARLLPDQKRRIERAASLRGLSISDFIVQNADEAAIRTIQQHESWTLNEEDRELFVRSLLEPSEPNDHLKAAFGRYRERLRIK